MTSGQKPPVSGSPGIGTLLAKWAAKTPAGAPEPPAAPAPARAPAPAPEPSESDDREAKRQRLIQAQEAYLKRLEEVAQKKRAPAAKKRFATFVQEAWKVLHPTEPLSWNWHLGVIADHCQALAESLLRARKDPSYQMPDQNLVFNVPPRSLKTEIVGVYFPAWLWLQDPTLWIRYMAGNERVRTLASRANRDLIASSWYRETFDVEWSIRADADNVGNAENTVRGVVYYSTYEQKITGEGTDVIINDDPLDAAQASSDIERTKVNEKWGTAIKNRVRNPKQCLRIGIMQRLHEDDWTAAVLAKGETRHVSIPMEYEISRECRCADCSKGESILGPYDPRTEEGELLHPDRFGEREIREAKAEGSYYYAGQYQQRPAPADGGMFKRQWWRYYEPLELPRFRRVLLFADCQAKKHLPGEHGSRTCLLVIGEIDEYRYVLDNRTGNLGPTEIGPEILRLIKKWPQIRRAVIEETAAGYSVIESLRAAGVPVDAWKVANDSKEARAFAGVVDVERGNVLLPKAAPWVPDFVHEHAVFPNGKNDDQVDTLAMGLVYIRGNKTMSRWKL